MVERWRRLLDDRFLAGIGLAFVLFVGWQFANHYFLMEYLMAKLGMSMLYYHYLSLVVEVLLAGIIVLFASRALIEKSCQLEDLGRQKDALADALVHDLRQPLTAVIAGLSTLSGDPDLPAATSEVVGIARSGANELLGMVNDLLDITRLEAGKPLLHPQPVAVPTFVQRGVAAVAELAREREQQLTVDLESDLPPVLGDGDRLSRVVTNLVGNAIKFTPSEGRIRVAAARSRGGDGVCVSVSDTGPGIAKELQQRIFDRFATVEASAPGRHSTGLGLTFCKMVVEAHGGSIHVEGEPGLGSTFVFSLPVMAEAAVAAGAPRS